MDQHPAQDRMCGRCVWGIVHEDGPDCASTNARLLALGLHWSQDKRRPMPVPDDRPKPKIQLRY